MIQDTEYLDKLTDEVKEGLALEGTEFDPEELTSEMYNNELNWNNADRTTGMSCYTECEINDMIKSIFESLKSDLERCAECGCLLSDDDYETTYESRGEHFGTPCSEQITTGYCCHTCGNTEDY